MLASYPWADAAWQDAALLGLALILDIALGEPPRALHPVVWMGRVIGILERMGLPRGRVGALSVGVLAIAVVPLGFGGVAALLMLGLRELGPVAYMLGGAMALKSTFSVRDLGRAATRVRRSLDREDQVSAVAGLASLVSRDVGALTPPQMASAAVESVAENAPDSFLAPWLAFALLGVPGAVAYRAVNTLDAMIGYHGRYEWFGKPSARLDDLLNLLPARLAGLLVAVAGGLLGLAGARSLRVMWRDHGRTESPNAGWPMSAMAGALGVRLEKVGHYRLGEEFPPPEAGRLGDAVRVIYGVASLGMGLAVALIWVRSLVW
jgi:adenosylcobinamide-phosphate synthase